MIKIACVGLVAISLAGCQTNSNYYADFARGVGAVVNAPKTYEQIKNYSNKIAKYCTEIKLGSTALDLFAPEKAATAISIARSTILDFCNKPPQNLTDALVILASTAALIEQARKEAKV